MLVYTSGSTGRPKGVMMTHRNVDAASDSITTYLKNTADDIILNVSPLAFDYGLYQLLMSVRVSATLVLEKSFAFPAAIFETMASTRCTAATRLTFCFCSPGPSGCSACVTFSITTTSTRSCTKPRWASAASSGT